MLIEDLGDAFQTLLASQTLRRLFESFHTRSLESWAPEVLREGWCAEKIIKVIFQCGGDLSSSGVKPFRSSGLRSHGSPADIRGRRLAV